MCFTLLFLLSFTARYDNVKYIKPTDIFINGLCGKGGSIIHVTSVAQVGVVQNDGAWRPDAGRQYIKYCPLHHRNDAYSVTPTNIPLLSYPSATYFIFYFLLASFATSFFLVQRIQVFVVFGNPFQRPHNFINQIITKNIFLP